MISEAKQLYGQAILARRKGMVSGLDGSEPFTEIKPDFYADAKDLTDEVLATLQDMEATHPPYGLVSKEAQPVVDFGARFWQTLENSWKHTMRYAFDQTKPSLAACPYHTDLKQRLGKIEGVDLAAVDGDAHGLDTLREVTLPGGWFASDLIVPLAARMPEIARIHGASISAEELALNSITLLRKPLNHPQQWATAFVLSLNGRSLSEDCKDRQYRRSFLTPLLIRDYLQLGHSSINGAEQLEWAKPIEDFTVPMPIGVVNRVIGSERNPVAEGIVDYPSGVRIGDIATNEPTIGCPGRKVAFYMWERTIRIAAAEGELR